MDGSAIKTTLGRNIKFLRFRNGFSQANLAEKAEAMNHLSEDIHKSISKAVDDVFKQYLG